MRHNIKYHPDVEKDKKKIGHSRWQIVLKAIEKVAENPVPKNEGGYGEPLGNKHGYNLTGLLKIKLLKLGIRIVYKVIREGNVMKIIVVAARADEEVYGLAARQVELD